MTKQKAEERGGRHVITGEDLERREAAALEAYLSDLDLTEAEASDWASLGQVA